MIRLSLLVCSIGLAVPAAAQQAADALARAPIRAFMDAIPQLDEVPYAVHTWHTGTNYPLNREQTTYHVMKRHALAHSFIQDSRNGAGRGEALIGRAVAGFTAECTAKGGHLEPRGSRPFQATLKALFADSSAMNWLGSTDPFHPVFDLLVCSAAPNASLGALTVTYDRQWRRAAIVLFAPTAVVTQADLDRADRLEELLTARQMDQERAEVARLPKWHRTLSSGSETACGPILSTSGGMVEVVDPRTRQPRWYRRGELLPAHRLDGTPNSCG